MKDRLVGINATRLVTLLSPKSQGVFSLGRVQTPVLRMVVDRHLAHVNFVSETCFLLAVRAKVGDHAFKLLAQTAPGKGKSSAHKYETKGEAELARGKVGKELTVSKFTLSQRREKPPLLFDLTSIQREANKQFGLPASGTPLWLTRLMMTFPQ